VSHLNKYFIIILPEEAILLTAQLDITAKPLLNEKQIPLFSYPANNN
jgi:hypothetical protein